MRVLIADDEYHVRKRLSERLPWTDMGFNDIVLCDDGDIALEKLIESSDAPFSVLITDIRMPRMDGLTLIRKAREFSPDLITLIMSAYDDKEYLKSAIDLHVNGYLEKPLNLEKVIQALENARDLEKSRIKTQVSSSQRYENHENIRSLVSELIHMHSFDDCRPLFTELKRIFPVFFTEASEYLALIIHASEQELTDETDSISRIQKSAAAFFRSTGTPCIISVNKDNVVILLSSNKHSLTEAALSISDLNLRISAGSIVHSPQEIYISYQNAVVTHERHFYHSEPFYMYNEAITGSYSFNDDDLLSFERSLQSSNYSVCCQYINTLYRHLMLQDCTLVRSTKNFYFRLALSILSAPASDTAKTDDHYYLWELIYRADSLKQLNDYILDLLNAALKSEAADTSADSIEHIKEYISQHIKDPGLSLTQISRDNFMSVAYLCMFFKEHTGMTLKAYLTEYRMKQAASLLSNTSMKIAEIAELTGFSDQNYFTKRFRKYYGVTPSQYKESTHN